MKTITKVLSLGLILGISTISIEVQANVTDFTSIHYESGKLTVNYRTGGGCQPHRAVFEIEPTSISKDLVKATVSVDDYSPEPDLCEALIPVSGSANVRELVKEQLSRRNISVNKDFSLELSLPVVTVFDE